MKEIICNGISLAAIVWLAVLPVGAQSSRDNSPAAQPAAPIPMDQLGVVAGKQYQGDGLSVSATPDGARLRCAFQRLEGEVTRDGLWLRSTAGAAAEERFRVMAVEVGRQSSDRSAVGCEAPAAAWTVCFTRCGWVCDHSRAPLESTGSVSVNAQTVRFSRPGLTEEYSVSVDGVRQDFILEQRLAGDGELRVELGVTGARVEPLVNGARLVLDGSGRKLAYNRLRVVDATGRELPARMEVAAGVSPAVEDGILPPGSGARTMGVSGFHCGEFASSGFSAGLGSSAVRPTEMPAATTLAVVVDDAAAVYPVQIDPTFSDADWLSMGGLPGANNTVRAAVLDGSGNLYIGGDFTIVGDVFANRIAKWNGNSWAALGSGIGGSSPSVYALAVLGGDVFAGGYFTDAGGSAATNIAKWNGSNWTAVESGVNDYVSALAVSGSDLYAGGNFTYAGGSEANRIAKWDGSSWTAMGLGMNDSVRALVVLGSNLYAGGYFTNAGGGLANCIAKWDGASWTALDSGLGGIPPGFSPPFVFALTVSGSDLYAGGNFLTAGDSAALNIAKWNGSSWTNLSSGINNIVSALAVWGGELYAGGYFSEAGGNPASKIARWNGTNWAALGSGMAGGSGYPNVLAFAAAGSNLYVGGDFTTVDGRTVNYVAKWDESNWTTLGAGMDGNVLQLAVSGGDLYVGGSFTTVGGIAANRVARWNGNSWTNLGSGLGDSVRALAVSGSNVYAGGYFTTAGGSVANRIAKWNGNSWTNLGSGMSSWVLALALSGSNLYAGGAFTTAGGRAANYIARWNGSSWTNLGSGMNQYVTALAVSVTNVFAGGQFTKSGGSNANYIAKWNGTSWTNLESGMNGFVWSLALSGDDLYVVGPFTTAGGRPANRIAKWNGGSWTNLGSGLNNSVYALAISGSDIYAGGIFTTAGGGAANSIAKWDGSTWTNLGSGMDKGVYALTISDSDLYAGGGFAVAGGKVSAYLAKANLPKTFSPGRLTSLAYSQATGFSCTFSDGTIGQPYRVQTSPSLAVGPWTVLTNFIYASPVVITDPAAVLATNTFYRAVTP